MSARSSATGAAGSQSRGFLRPWLGLAASAALHAAPLLLPLQQSVRQVLSLRPSELQVELLHEAAAPRAADGAAEAVSSAALAQLRATELAAAPVTAARNREAVRAATSAAAAPAASVRAVAPPSPSAEPAVSAEPAPSVAAVPAPPVATASAAAPAANTAGPVTPVTPGVGSASFGVGNGTGLGSAVPGAGAGPGAGRAASSADLRALRGRYLGQLRERVLARREYPRLARRARLEGTVCLRISLDAAGRLAQVRPTCAAPAPLQEAALRAVREAAPFGPLPSALGQELVLDLPMVFQLDAG